MQHDRLITGIAVSLGACSIVLAVVGFVYNLAILFVALMIAAAAYFMWYQASGRLARKVYRSVEQQARTNGSTQGQSRTRTRERGGFGAGPREEWTPPRDGGRGRQQGRVGGQGQQRRRAPSTTDKPSEAEAYRTLGVEPGADDATVKQAYRRKVKEVHPDTEGGDEETFKRVNRAYERLS